MFFDMNGGEHVLAHETLGNEDRVLVIVAFPFHEADEDIFAEREFAVVGRGAVRDDLARRDAVARMDDRALVEAGPLVGALELFHFIFVDKARVGADLDEVGRNADGDARVLRLDHDAAVARDRRFDARRHDGAFGL